MLTVIAAFILVVLLAIYERVCVLVRDAASAHRAATLPAAAPPSAETELTTGGHREGVASERKSASRRSPREEEFDDLSAPERSWSARKPAAPVDSK